MKTKLMIKIELIKIEIRIWKINKNKIKIK